MKWTIILQVITSRAKWLWQSADSTELGPSQKKLIAYVYIIVPVIIQFIYMNKENFIELVFIDLGFAAAILGVREISQVQMKKLDKAPVVDQPPPS